MISEPTIINAFYEQIRESNEEPFIIFSANDFAYPLHFHYSFELIFVLSGEFLMQVNNEKLKMRSGDVAVLAPGDIHGYQTVGSSQVVIFLFLEEEFPELKSIFSTHILRRNVFRYPNSGVVDILEKQKSTQDKILLKLCFKGYVNTLFSEILKIEGALTQQSPEAKDRTIRKALIYVRQEYDNGINLEQTARAIGLSSSHLSRLFKRLIGCTFSEYVSQLRVEKSKRLLREDAMSIYEITAECGFENQRSFDRSFKKLTQLTPREYRRKYSRDLD